MGAVKSKSGHSAHQHNEGQILQQLRYTEGQILQQLSYNGVPCEYHFFSLDQLITSNHYRNRATPYLNADVPHLLQMYDKGCRLLSFQLIPGSIHLTSGCFSTTCKTILTAQGIFRKIEPSENRERFSLQVVKSPIESSVSLLSHRSSTQTHTQHIYKVIHEHACQGCRLLCITDCVRAHTDQINPRTMIRITQLGEKVQNGVSFMTWY